VFGTVLTAVITPFRGDLVDEEAFRGLLAHLVSNGSDGIVTAGTTGEASTLTDAERIRLFEISAEELRGRASFVAGTGSNDTAHSVHMTEAAKRLGADAALVVTPYYNRPPPEGIIRHFQAVAEVGLPIVAYNIPTRTGINMPPALIAELCRRVPAVVAVKQSNDDLAQSQEIAETTDVALYAGNDDLFRPLLNFGGAGVISVASHLVGDRLAAMATAFRNGDHATADSIDQSLDSLYRGLFTTANPILVKAALQMTGQIPSDHLRLPLVAATNSERDALREVLEAQGLLSRAIA
jgi:4-hydroxy-tetrahydrodipicolinate synthase